MLKCSWEPPPPSPAEVIPALDLLGGRVVRLVEGRYDRVTEFPVDPLEAARGFAEAGARWLHLVDLDAARSGITPAAHAAVLERLVEQSGMRLQVGGGVRSADHVERLLGAGVARVMVGSLAAEPRLVGRLAAATGAVAAAVDVLGGRVRVAGWTRDGGVAAGELVRRLVDAGVRDLLVTAIDRDGTGTGPDLALIGEMREHVPGVLIAAGGVAGEDGVAAAVRAGADAVVLGRAVHDGSLDLRRALAVATSAWMPRPRPRCGDDGIDPPAPPSD